MSAWDELLSTKPTNNNQINTEIVSNVEILNYTQKPLQFTIKLIYPRSSEILENVKPRDVKTFFSDARKQIPEKFANLFDGNELKNKSVEGVYTIIINKKISQNPPSWNITMTYHFADSVTKNISHIELKQLYKESNLQIPDQIARDINDYESKYYAFTQDTDRRNVFDKNDLW